MAEKSNDASPSESASTPSHQEDKSTGNWWDSWISSAKTKSAEVYTMVRKDLDEIGTAVKSEASHVFSSTSNVIGKTFKLDEPESPANVMKKSLSTFIGQMSTALYPVPDDEDETEIILSSGDTTMLSTYKKELEALQRVDATFIVPAYSPEFDAWLASLESPDAVISPSSAVKRLDTSPVLRAQYDKLVPDACSHVDFWQRYLFRVALLQDRLAAASRKQPQAEPTADPVLAHLPLQTQPIQQSPKKVLSGLENEKLNEEPELTEIDNDVVSWEDEDFANDVELTEEQQILLLEEYEKEITSKKTKNSPKDVANNNTSTQTNIQKKLKTKSAQTKQNKSNNNKKNRETPKKSAKNDVCGNNLVEDYFAEKDSTVKDDASANSDESWEKEFEIDEVDQKA